MITSSKGPTFTKLTAKNLMIEERIQLKRRKLTKIVLAPSVII